MALNGLDIIFGAGKDFIPHIEERALRWADRRGVMAQRVVRFDDMRGWNVRKISEYLKYRNAQDLDEDTAIPNTILTRARKAEFEPHEVGDMYRISDRRQNTDLESIVSDTIEALGSSIGDRRERDLMAAAMAGFFGGTLGDGTADFDLSQPIDIQHELRHRAQGGLIYVVLHPFQAKKILKDLIIFSGSGAGVNLAFRESAIRSWTVPGFDNMNVVVSDFLPRRVVHNVKVYGTGGTFRLAVGDGYTVGVNVTAAITASAVAATQATNIKNALEALTFDGNGTWTVTGATSDALVVTPPATLFLDAESELRVAVNISSPTLAGEKSAYDLVTGTTPGAHEDINGDDLGLEVTEKSGTAKALTFLLDALALDNRDRVHASFELVNQGRTAEYAAYTTYAEGRLRGERGMFIYTKANSAFATG